MRASGEADGDSARTKNTFAKYFQGSTSRILHVHTRLYEPENLSFDPDVGTEAFSFDNDGSFQERISADGTSKTYTYEEVDGQLTHRVRNITGTRENGSSLSDPNGNFLYDARGRLVEDKGSGTTYYYGFYSDRPVRIENPTRTWHYLYDENLNRVAELEVSGGSVIGAKTTVYESGLDVAREYVTRTPSHPLGAVTLVKSSLWGQMGQMGQMGQIGVEDEATGQKKLFAKDHLGSLAKVLDEGTGGYAGEDEYGYWAYGVLNKRQTSADILKPTGTYTGKEYIEALNLYYFGARFYDPELGLWLSPDPARQFFNPYAYGGDPVNFVDPDGEFIIEAMIIGAIAGAYFGGVGANGSFNPLKWDYGETWDEIAVGGIIGGAAGGLGAYVGGPAMLAGQATGALGWGATAGLAA